MRGVSRKKISLIFYYSNCNQKLKNNQGVTNILVKGEYGINFQKENKSKRWDCFTEKSLKNERTSTNGVISEHIKVKEMQHLWHIS